MRNGIDGMQVHKGGATDLRNDHSSPIVLGGMAQKSLGESVSGYSNPDLFLVLFSKYSPEVSRRLRV